MKKYIKDGRWCISGTAYENGDVNIPSPEALIRNILLGDRYFKCKFGKSSKDLFLPDCFGFGWALPSVANHCGLLGLTTQKLSWGSAYDVPFDLGKFTGPDGKSIYASLKPGSYRHEFCSDIRGDLGVINSVYENANASGLPWADKLYGTGDWGGSPTEESVQAVEESVADNKNNSFQVVSASSDEIFKDLDRLSDSEKDALPEWNNELLMTSHGAGCYTSRGMSKRLNRQNEQLAVTAEKACTYAYLLGEKTYPRNIFNQAWKRVVAHQFHDDLTGTSTMEAYNDSWSDYYLSLSQFKNELTYGLRGIGARLDTSWIDEKSVAVIVNNPTQFKRKSVVDVKVRTVVNCSQVAVFDCDGNEVPSEANTKEGKVIRVAFIAELDGFESKAYEIKPAKEKCKIKTDIKATNHSLENSKYKIIFNKNGDIAYLFDKRLNKQVIDKPIKMALLHDTGSLSYPSWEIRKKDIDAEPYCYANTPVFTVVESGPARASIKIEREMEHSTITQFVNLDSDGEYITVKNYVDWKTRRTLLKAVFPMSCCNDKATYDLGLGVIERGNNTERLYEVPAQKWADITDRSGEFGVSIFSDCKCGWDKPNDNTLRLSCIHTPAGAFTKDARQDLQDLGRNIFSFAIYSHADGFENGTQKNSELYANPIVAIQTTGRHKRNGDNSLKLASISNDNVIIRAIKLSENDNRSLIVRVNEANGKRCRNVSLKVSADVYRVYEVNGVEEKIKERNLTRGGVIFNLNPFEIKTFRFVFDKRGEDLKETRFTVIPLEYNAWGYTENSKDMRNVILQGSGLSLPKELRPVGKYCVGGIPFHFNHKACKNGDVLVCRGQTIEVPESCNRLYFIAGSTLAKQDDYIVEGRWTSPICIKPITRPLSKWDMAGLDQVLRVYSNDKLGIEFPYTHHPEGINTQKAIFGLHRINLDGSKTITLPDNNRIVILAMTACCEDKTDLVVNVEDTSAKMHSFDDDVPPIDKIIDRTDALTIRAGKIQDQKNSGKGKGFRRDNIITNVIRSYTKSEW